MLTNLPLFGCFRKGFITHSFCKWPLHTLDASWTQDDLRDFETHDMNQDKTQCWALVISKASFTKTTIDFLNRFSTLIDHCTMKSPNFVSIENFQSCLTWAEKWVNIEAMSYQYIWLRARLHGVGDPGLVGLCFFCFHALGDTKQKKLTPLDRGPPLHVNRV